jgi:Lipid A core - O-antigen ligase and related enzymes
MTKSKITSYVEYVGGYAALLLLFAIALSRALMHISVAVLAVSAILYAILNGTGRWRGLAPAWSLRTVLLFFTAVVISIFLSQRPGVGFENLPMFAYLLATPIFFIPFVGLPQVRKWGVSFFIAGFILGLVVIFSRYPFIIDTAVRYRPFLAIMDYGGTLGIAYPVVLSFFIRSLATSNKKYALLYGALSFLILAAAMYNGTRAIWGSIAVSTVVVALLNIRRLKWPFLAHVVVSLLFVYGFTYEYPVFREQAKIIEPQQKLIAQDRTKGVTPIAPTPDVTVTAVEETSTDPSYDLMIQDPLADPSVNFRIKLWKDSFSKWVAYPFFGIGFANTPYPLTNKNMDIVGYSYDFFAHCHNTFLQIATETGFLGLLTYLGLAIPSLALAVGSLRSKDDDRRFWAKILLAVITAFAIHSMSDYVFDIKTVIYLFAFMLACCWFNLKGNAKSSKQPIDKRIENGNNCMINKTFVLTCSFRACFFWFRVVVKTHDSNVRCIE